MAPPVVGEPVGGLERVDELFADQTTQHDVRAERAVEVRNRAVDEQLSVGRDLEILGRDPARRRDVQDAFAGRRDQSDQEAGVDGFHGTLFRSRG